jgi:hypothetical protein
MPMPNAIVAAITCQEQQLPSHLGENLYTREQHDEQMFEPVTTSLS